MLPTLFYSPRYQADIGPHVFPMQKFALTRKLLLELERAVPADFAEPDPATDEQVLAVHERAYVDKLRQLRLSEEEIGVLELPLSRELVEAVWRVAGGTVAACRRALETGWAANLSGGFHHAFAGHGEGFCVLNDIAIGVTAVLHEGRVGRAAVLDLDVHQGNGTAAIFQEEPRVFTCSLHQEHNYPLAKPASDLDIGLPDGCGGERYLAELDRALDAVGASAPELLVYVAGADVYCRDQLGGLALSIDDIEARDRCVLERCRQQALPVAVVLAGGYAFDLFDTVSIHARTIGLGLELLVRRPETRQ